MKNEEKEEQEKEQEKKTSTILKKFFDFVDPFLENFSNLGKDVEKVISTKHPLT